jgi:hypothetical protein
MLACRYPNLPLALVHKVLAYYLENQTEVDAYVAASLATMDEEQRGAQQLEIGALRRRLAGQPMAPETQAH